MQKELVPTCRELGIGMLAYSPMGRGLLTGAFKPDELPDDDFRKSIPGTYYSRENVETVRSAAAVAALVLARRYRCQGMACTCHVQTVRGGVCCCLLGQGSLSRQVLTRSAYVLSPSCSSLSALRPAHASTQGETNPCCAAVLACAGSLTVQDTPHLPSLASLLREFWPLAVTRINTA